MKITRRLAPFALSALAALVASPAMAADPVTGVWKTEDGDALVRIGDCGSSVCGRIARFLVTPPQGAGQRDVNNPDPRLRNRKLLGLPVLSGFTEESELWRGTIYDPKAGKSYRSVIRRTGPGTLEVKGCIGPFCQTQIWQKAK